MSATATMTFAFDAVPLHIIARIVNYVSVDTRRTLAVTSKLFLTGVIASGIGTLHSHLLLDYLRTASVDGESTFDDVLLSQLENRLEQTRYLTTLDRFFH